MPRKRVSTQFTLKGNWRPGAYTPFSVILPSLIQGDCDGVQDSKFLRKHHISHVVTMGFVGPPEEVVAAQDLRVCEIDVKDSAGARVDKHFEEAVMFIHEGRSCNGTLYVHCYSGTSGSSAIVAAYLMVWLDVSYADAIRFVRSCRPCADPNPSFKKQLKNFGNETEKISALREKIMKMGPAAKRDERLKEDMKLFKDAMDVEGAKDAASGVARVSVDNGGGLLGVEDGGAGKSSSSKEKKEKQPAKEAAATTSPPAAAAAEAEAETAEAAPTAAEEATAEEATASAEAAVSAEAPATAEAEVSAEAAVSAEANSNAEGDEKEKCVDSDETAPQESAEKAYAEEAAAAALPKESAEGSTEKADEVAES